MEKHARYTRIPVLRITPGLVYAYDILDPPPSRRQEKATAFLCASPAPEKYTGILTPDARKRLIKYINLLVAIALPKKAIHFQTGKEFTFRVNFITLTLPAEQGSISDEQLKRGPLKQWIEYWRGKLPGMSYVWRAERQKNGNLHFHLVTDRYILYSDIRDTWNNRLSALGFIDKFEQKHGHRHPNSTDVHAVARIRNLGAYIAKYMSKTESVSQPISGRVWDCSANLKKKDSCQWPMDAGTIDHFRGLYESAGKESFVTDFCAGFRYTEQNMRKLLPASWVAEYQAYLQRVRDRAM